MQEKDFMSNATDATCEFILNLKPENLFDVCSLLLAPVLAMGNVDRSMLRDYKGIFGQEVCFEMQIM